MRDREHLKLTWKQAALGILTEIGYAVGMILIGLAAAYLAVQTVR